ncbi:hypothetical protein [Asanoa hainanensis]|uniref:hypothetical protein n=1 Tax=Asanoa hainanensis TaxID=560556 RepID=UPI0015C60D07|nr:hypothetical protein [Asanoa hainanensis]
MRVRWFVAVVAVLVIANYLDNTALRWAYRGSRWSGSWCCSCWPGRPGWLSLI